MAKKTIAARKAEGKEAFRSKLTKHEIALIAELLEELVGAGRTMRQAAYEVAARFA